MFRTVDHLLRPRTIAIIGASDSSRGGWAREIYENLEFSGFPAKVYLVNPKRTELWGRPVYPNFAALPEPVDLALTIIPSPAIPETLAEAAANGLRCALIYAAQFGEGGDAEGQRRADALRALCDKYGLRISGPNCMGSVALRENLLLYPSTRVRGLRPGGVGVVFQSGGTFQFWLQQASLRGLDFSYAVSSGNELDLDLADYISFLVDDPSTRIIACMVEGIRRPKVFMAAAAKALAARKPIIMVKLGRSTAGQAAAQSHTGAIASDAKVFDAVCRRYGIISVPSLDDMIEGCLAFGQGRLPKGPLIGMSCYSGGSKGLALDYAADEGAAMAPLTEDTKAKLKTMIDPGLAAENPLDCGPAVGVRAKPFAEICKVVCADPTVDLVTVQGLLPVNPTDAYDPAPLRSVFESTEKPVLAFGRIAQNVSEISRKFQAETGVPFIHGLPQTVRALRNLVRYAEVLQRPAPPSDPPVAARPPDAAALDALLAAHDLVAPRSALATTPDDAATKAAAIGFPVAVKIVSPQASHKTEVGGVALHLDDAAAVRAAAERMAARLHATDAHATIDGFLVQEMVDGVEMLIGVREDPQFGPIMAVGFGGIAVEAIKDVAIRLLPIDHATAADMICSLRGAELLGAFRGRAARDTPALTAAMIGLSRLFMAYRPWISDMEVNPLIVRARDEGACAVDVRIIPRAQPGEVA
ncbi:MAG TPA: acetate--CoA ligase family protein [Xanthobacteraceae bacterium]|nr:acetate--CoA ligase family protein [Xanthobacteraceae bacterium]